MTEEFTLPMCRVPGVPGFPAGIDDGSICRTVNNPYLIAQTPVTYKQWTVLYQWAVGHGYQFENSGMKGSTGAGSELQPVTMLSWRDAIAACNALTEYHNFQNNTSHACVYEYNGEAVRNSTPDHAAACDFVSAVSDAKGFRLPASMEWELAARYIDGRSWTPGSYASGAAENYQDKNETQKVACYEDNSNMATCPVQTKSPNALGLYDMAGNVWEWCYNAYGASHRIARGGSCYDISFVLQSGFFISCDPSYAHNSFGFRPVRTE